MSSRRAFPDTAIERALLGGTGPGATLPLFPDDPTIPDPDFVQYLIANHYSELRMLPDGTIAGLYRLLYTTAICTGLTWSGYAYRYCFADTDHARVELSRLNAMDDEPAGYVARR